MHTSCLQVQCPSAAVLRLQVLLALLPNGNVLTAGGQTTGGQQDLASAEVFNVKTHQWATVGPLATGRSLHQVLDC